MAKKAFLVGINDYAPIGQGGPDLRGCVCDARDMAHTLFSLHVIPAFPRSLRILTDCRATKDNIMKGIKWLIGGAKKDDLLIFYYSGHGSQVVDTNVDEPDHWDETICPHDFATAGMIIDDEIRTLLRTVPPGVNLEVIFDSCHSGTATRSITSEERGLEASEVVDRYVDPPIDYGYFLDTNPTLARRGLLKAAPGEREPIIVAGMNHVLWAACRDYQTSQEGPIGEGSCRIRGAFTYCFCKVLRRAGVNITRRKLDALVCADLRRMGYGQVPQLEGTRQSLDEKVFT